jgi:hypothetical protein
MAVPERELRRAHRRTGTHRPDLRVAGPTERVQRARQHRTGARLVAGLLALFLALFGNAVAHSVLVSGQEHLDGLNARVEQEQARNQRLHLRAAALESPDRIVQAAKDLDMVQPDQTEWLAVPEDGTVASATDEGTSPNGSGDDAGVEELAGSGEGDATDAAGK